MKSKDQAIFEIFYVKESNSLISRECFCTLTPETDLSQTCGFWRKLKDHQYFPIQVKKVYMNGLALVKTPKPNLVLGHFWGFPSPPPQTKDVN